VSWLFEKTLGSLFPSRSADPDKATSAPEEQIGLAIEAAIDSIHPRLRLVNRYQEKLAPSVEHALHYIDEQITNIPQAVEISRATFVSDPRVNAFFANVKDIEQSCRQSSELRAFFEDDYPFNAECWALMCMKKTERKVFGLALDGEMLQREVPQVTVSFSDHQIQAPATSEEEARQGLKCCIYESLVNRARSRIQDCKDSLLRLETERHSLNTRLRRLEAARDDKANAERHGELERDIAAAKARIQISERKLIGAECTSPQECVNQLRDVMEHPEEFIRMSHSTLRLNRLGVRVDDASNTRANSIEVSEVEISSKNRRVVVLARLPHMEFPRRRDLIEEAERYLAF
jgi:hypothetical protein